MDHLVFSTMVIAFIKSGALYYAVVLGLQTNTLDY